MYGRNNNSREFEKEVGKRERRKLKARRIGDRQSVWFGLGMFGIVGWSVAIPTLLGIIVGIWIDTRWPSRFSWTLMLLFIGILLGCFNAWYWVSRERNEIEEENRIDRNYDKGI
ncbi:MAG: AtpZ/AtpI family protein [Nitrospirota bacterium]